MENTTFYKDFKNESILMAGLFIYFIHSFIHSLVHGHSRPGIELELRLRPVPDPLTLCTGPGIKPTAL